LPTRISLNKKIVSGLIFITIESAGESDTVVGVNVVMGGVVD
jgi:hypothetical protein